MQIRRFSLLLAAVLGFATLGPVAQASAAADPGPALETPVATLAANLECSADLADSAKTPVLLTPGTTESADQAYSWGYRKVLREQGHAVCVIKDLPASGTTDMQVTAEYVVYAIRHMSEVSGGKVSVVGHSQGGLLNAWALRFWPDLAGKVDDIVGLATPHSGGLFGDIACVVRLCPDSAWQFRPSSRFIQALIRQPLAEGPDFTSIGSDTDEVIFPAPGATRFPGATNVQVQDLCPGRLTGHMGQLYDAGVHSLVMDALNHDGPADLRRASKDGCSRWWFEGVDEAKMAAGVLIVADVLKSFLDVKWVGQEPALKGYAVDG
ncbi:hypothetical protein HUT18_14840 [Streptomyces sp. NA04227]|uniref:esterase/lipase family protein n=1 Tax=Streptomyces sp. NA04227 TaxID=2742136 RepID=UPI0015922829|nr:hypothetical protein [Streptomyces sp. NA04227]QKW07469.1 hypothetical protein HUT18_14840 [Streptomyces sp. NA04227]